LAIPAARLRTGARDTHATCRVNLWCGRGMGATDLCIYGLAEDDETHHDPEEAPHGFTVVTIHPFPPALM
jgi:hypothetical protein